MLYSIPFFFIDHAYWLIATFPLSLFIFFSHVQKTEHSYLIHTRIFFYGVLWGMIVFGLHFLWLADILLYKSHASHFLALTLYFILVLYFSFTSGIWFLVTGVVSRLFAFNVFFLAMLTTSAYFYFIEHYSFWFLSCTKGYPFLSPLIPLRRVFFLLLGLVGLSPCASVIKIPPTGIVIEEQEGDETYRYRFLKLSLPEDWGIASITQTLTPSHAAQVLYHALTKLNKEEKECKCDATIILAPESAFPFPLNEYEEVQKLWSCCMTDKMHLLLCAARREEGKKYQSVFWLHQCQIKNFYDKTHVVDFTENVPRLFSSFAWANALFKGDVICPGSKKQKEFSGAPSLCFYPLICSELFFSNRLSQIDENKKNKPAIAFINDSWFMHYFSKILFAQAELKATYSGRQVIYVGYVTTSY